VSDGVSQPTETAAPAASTTTAAPAKAAPTPALTPKADKPDSEKSGLAVLREIRSARRAPKTDKAKAQPQEADNAMEIDPALLEGAQPGDGDDVDADDTTDVDPNAETETDDGETDDDVEPPDEQKPTWAQKLRADIAKKTERLAVLERQHAEREQRFEQAARHVEHRIEDVTDDLKAEQRYSAALEAAIAKSGFNVPADWKRAFQAEHKANKLERQLSRGKSVEQSKTVEVKAAEARDKVTTLAKQFPELDWKTSPEGKAWLASRFAQGGKGMRDLEQDALIFVKALRYDRSQKNAARTPQQTQRAPKPAPTLAGQRANVGRKTTAAIPSNEKESAAWLAARKAARG
jgi:hypothetical protein